MNTTDLLSDGAVVLRTLSRPTGGLSALAERPRAGVALALATALSLCAAAVVVPRTDYGAGDPGEPGKPEPTQYEREQSALTARKLGELQGWAGAALLPTVLATLAACGLSIGFRAAGAPAGFRPSLAVAAHGMLPLWLARLLAIPATVAHAPVPQAEVPSLVPSSLAALLPRGAPAGLSGALGAVDLFALWALWLVATGMARVAGASRARALTTTALLYVAYVALFRVALPSFLAGAAPTPTP